MQVNDQEDIIEALIQKNYSYVWERVKRVGYKDIADISERYIIFYKTVEAFHPEKNNNFILFYKNRLHFYKNSKNATYYVTSNRRIISILKNELISPSETCEASKLANELLKWGN